MIRSFRLGKTFRSRSASRDASEDIKRIMSINDAVQSALLSAHRELEGLAKRIERARKNCGSMMGNDTYGEDRDPQTEKALASEERELMNATRRVDILRAHIAGLRDIDGAVQIAMESSNTRSRIDENIDG